MRRPLLIPILAVAHLSATIFCFFVWAHFEHEGSTREDIAYYAFMVFLFPLQALPMETSPVVAIPAVVLNSVAWGSLAWLTVRAVSSPNQDCS